MDSKILGTRLKSCRERANESLELVGELVGVHKTTVMRWENGETRKISLDTVEKLATHFNVSPSWLAGKDVPMNRSNIGDLPNNIIPLPKTKKIPLLGTIRLRGTHPCY